ncbi:MAG TPA: HigA family addiction module antitoxin [Pseudonocardiaceae bacterium]
MSTISSISPGEILATEFLRPLGLSRQELAASVGVPPRQINGIIRGTCRIGPDIALRLAGFFGTSDRFWTNLQVRYDLDRLRDRRRRGRRWNRMA